MPGVEEVYVPGKLVPPGSVSVPLEATRICEQDMYICTPRMGFEV